MVLAFELHHRQPTDSQRHELMGDREQIGLRRHAVNGFGHQVGDRPQVVGGVLIVFAAGERSQAVELRKET